MSLLLDELVIGKRYKLTEFVERKEITSKEYFFVSKEEMKKKPTPALGFSQKENGKAEIFLTEAHTQFGDQTWRRSFRTATGWEIYAPVGTRTWNWSFVTIEEIPASEEIDASNEQQEIHSESRRHSEFAGRGRTNTE